ncbi:MAG: hypothetical protein KDC71_02800 [Acidobacteria bacterium]|nr:hypothetical protein [Acidobacteriota bacterium]
MVQDKNEILYFGNDSGILIFDGIQWERVATEPDRSVNSLALDDLGFILVGAQSEFGRLVQNQEGQYQYESLLHLFEEKERDFRTIWQLQPIAQGVVICTELSIFLYQHNTIRHLKTFPDTYNNQLFLTIGYFTSINTMVFMYSMTQVFRKSQNSRIFGKTS